MRHLRNVPSAADPPPSGVPVHSTSAAAVDAGFIASRTRLAGTVPVECRPVDPQRRAGAFQSHPGAQLLGRLHQSVSDGSREIPSKLETFLDIDNGLGLDSR